MYSFGVGGSLLPYTEPSYFLTLPIISGVNIGFTINKMGVGLYTRTANILEAAKNPHPYNIWGGVAAAAKEGSVWSCGGLVC